MLPPDLSGGAGRAEHFHCLLAGEAGQRKSRELEGISGQRRDRVPRLDGRRRLPESPRVSSIGGILLELMAEDLAGGRIE